MEYHHDRFEDYSLLIFKENKLIAIFPANKLGNTLLSHQGLSYGGFIISNTLRTEDYINAFSFFLKWTKANGFLDVVIKKMPSIYNKFLAEELEYVLHETDSKIVANNSYYVIDNTLPYKPNRNRKRGIKKANSIMEFCNDGMGFFWEHILTKNLNNKFGVKPVHNFKELELLQSHFPDQIKFYSARLNEVVHAGVVLFISENVVHFQYSSGREDRDKTGALDFLFDAIIKKYSNYKYISFGSSATDETLKIDSGLAYWKESFGACLIPQSTYAIKSSSFINLETIIK